MTKSVYVMRVGNGPVKIGIAADAEKRRTLIQKGQPHVVSIIHVTSSRRDAELIEQMAHRLLKAKRLNGEWFDVEPAEAEVAVAKAIELVEAGDVAFERDRPQINIRVNAEDRAQLDELRRTYDDLPSRSEIYRRAVQRLYEERCADKGKRK